MPRSTPLVERVTASLAFLRGTTGRSSALLVKAATLLHAKSSTTGHEREGGEAEISRPRRAAQLLRSSLLRGPSARASTSACPATLGALAVASARGLSLDWFSNKVSRRDAQRGQPGPKARHDRHRDNGQSRPEPALWLSTCPHVPSPLRANARPRDPEVWPDPVPILSRSGSVSRQTLEFGLVKLSRRPLTPHHQSPR